MDGRIWRTESCEYAGLDASCFPNQDLQIRVGGLELRVRSEDELSASDDADVSVLDLGWSMRDSPEALRRARGLAHVDSELLERLGQ